MTHPDLALLTGPDVQDLLAAAVATAGGDLVDWSVRQVDHRPGASTTASYDATVRWGADLAQETLGASIGLAAVDAPPGVLQLSDGGQHATVWRFPQDPGLPGLASGADPSQMATLLGSLGVPGIDAADVDIRVRAYRPRRRAVLEVRAPSAGFYVKALRPGKVEDLHRRHVLLHGAGLPVPRSLGWTDTGLLVLEPLAGTAMRRALCRPDAPLPLAGDVLALLDRLPEAVLDLPHRAAWSDNAGYYAQVIGVALPAEAARAAQLAEGIAGVLSGLPAEEPTHGDFYEAQLLLTGDRVTGLLDVDTAGPGRRADDLACLVAHVEVLASMYPQHLHRLRSLSRTWAAVMEERVDPLELRARVAGVIVSLATGPHRVQDPAWEAATSERLDLAEDWLERRLPADV